MNRWRLVCAVCGRVRPFPRALRVPSADGSPAYASPFDGDESWRYCSRCGMNSMTRKRV
jgi:hypothetical protein